MVNRYYFGIKCDFFSSHVQQVSFTARVGYSLLVLQALVLEMLFSKTAFMPLVCDVLNRVGGEKVMLLSAAAWGAMTAFTPILAHFCSQPIVSMTVSRFLMGLLQGE